MPIDTFIYSFSYRHTGVASISENREGELPTDLPPPRGQRPGSEAGFSGRSGWRAALHTNDELAGLTGCFVDGIGDDPGHDGSYEADTHDYDYFMVLFAVFLCEMLKAMEFFQ